MEQYDIIMLDDEEVLTRMFADASRLLSPNKKVAVFNSPTRVMELLDKKEISSRQWVLDYMMPTYDGIKIAKKIREVYGDSPAIFMYSAYSSSKFSEEDVRINGWYQKATTDIFMLLS